MTNEELLIECKKSLNISLVSTAFDDVLTQKILAVKLFMSNAGVSDDIMINDLAVGCIVLGVADLWNVESGEVKYSSVFYTFVNQLTSSSSIVTLTSNPADGATGVAITIKPTLTFNKQIESHSIRLVEYDEPDNVVNISAELDVTVKKLTITPASDLKAATKYAIVINKVVSYDGPSLQLKIISFTTA